MIIKKTIPIFHEALELYSEMCKPICEKLNMPQPAFDILLFLANYPEYCTARDITRYRGIKSNLVSIYVEKLVNEELLERKTVPEDRRQIRLLCTEKAQVLIEQGRQVQEHFEEVLKEGMSKEDIAHFEKSIRLLEKNLSRARDAVKKEGALGE